MANNKPSLGTRVDTALGAVKGLAPAPLRSLFGAFRGIWITAGKVLAPPSFVGLVLLLVGWIHIHQGSSSRHVLKPYEYVYLDRARVEAYLGQLDEGNVGQETRTNTSKNSEGGKVEIKALGEVSGSISNEKTSSAVVSFSEADNFYKLERTLESDDALERVQFAAPPSEGVIDSAHRSTGAARHPKPGAAGGNEQEERSERKQEEAQIEAENERHLETIPIGAMVKLVGVKLRAPSYMAAFPGMRYAEQQEENPKEDEAFEPAPLDNFSAAEVELKEGAREERARFVAQAGIDPRLPLSVKMPSLTVVVPARYAYLTGDPSLLDARLTIVGKLVQRRKEYGESAAVATYLPALLDADRPFLRDIGVKASFLDRYEGSVHERRVHLFEELERSLTYPGEAVEVIPIAIYD